MDLKNAAQPLRSVVDKANFGKRFEPVDESVRETMLGAKNSQLSVTEFVIAARVDLSPPQNRPHSWITSRNFKPPALAGGLSDIEWTIYPAAEDLVEGRPQKTTRPPRAVTKIP